MRIAVLSLTRDRLDYTKHCFGNLWRYAGCPFDHYVFDQGSHDGTRQWLEANRGRFKLIDLYATNIGISRGMNELLGQVDLSRYDLVVKFDNDCELVEAGTLATVARACLGDQPALLSPVIRGLRGPLDPQEFVDVNGVRVGVLGHIGGIFSCTPAYVYEKFRYDTSNPTWGMDDVQLSAHVNQMGGVVGYVMDVEANHYETTDGQWARYPEYFQQKIAEGLPT